MTASSASKIKLQLSPCDVDKNGIATVNASKPKFEAMINPASYQHTSSIKYAKNKALGPGGEEKFSKMAPDKLNFKEMVLDGTGVVPDSGTSTVREQIERLRAVAYNFNGSEHEAPVVEISWGPLLMKARLDGLTVDYTLFKPSGEPLRAKVTLNFTEFLSTEEILREASLESPDLTHLVEVKAGDTLPNLCYRIYKDASYYLEVARINELRNFRQLQPGQLLRFPPLG